MVKEFINRCGIYRKCKQTKSKTANDMANVTHYELTEPTPRIYYKI